jgi:hypothetical protein
MVAQAQGSHTSGLPGLYVRNGIAHEQGFIGPHAHSLATEQYHVRSGLPVLYLVATHNVLEPLR